MDFFEGFFASLHHFRSYPLRTSLTLVGIVIGAASIVAMVGIGEGTRVRIIDDMEKLGGTGLIVVQNDPQRVRMSRGTPGQWRLTWKDHRDILAATDLIEKTAPLAAMEAIFTAGQRRSVGPCLGITPDFFAMRRWEVQSGRTVHELDLLNHGLFCVLGYQTARNLFPGMEDPTGQVLGIGPRDLFTVIGVMSEHQVEGARWMNEQVFLPVTTFQERLSGDRYLERILVKARRTEDVPRIVGRILEVLAANHLDPDWFNIHSQTEVINKVKGSTRLLRTAFGTIAGIVLLIGGIGIMNLMLVSVSERTREIGIRKAVGARGRDIFSQILLESLMLTFMGGAAGIALGVQGGRLFSHLVASYLGSQVTSVVTPGTLLLAAGSVVAVGVAFGIYPALRASRLDPARAVGYE